MVSIYLWPFFAVWSLNRRSWSGLDRGGFNRFNGILTLCLLDYLALLASLQPGLTHKLTKAGAIGILFALLAVHSIWLDGSRGERLRQRFASAPQRTRSFVRAISATVFGGALVFFVTVLPWNPPLSRSMNCGDASEVTAAACDIESGH
jgi:hypothetical protein